MEKLMEKLREEPFKADKDIAVVGGGAAGLVAAISAARSGASVLILERQERLGKKILVTGNGRCNFSNRGAQAACYHGDPSFAGAVLARFGVAETLRFFAELGLLGREEGEGRLYPVSNQANAVLDCLRLETARLGVESRCGVPVVDIQPLAGGFRLRDAAGRDTFAKRLVLATGGAAKGGSLSGYELLTRLGQPQTPRFAALTGIKIDHPACRSLKGLRVKGEISLWQAGRCQRSERGELQFTDYGLSGIAVFNLARLLHGAKDAWLQLDLLPEYTLAELQEHLQAKQSRLQDFPVEDLGVGLLPKRLAQALLQESAPLPLSTSLGRAGADVPAAFAKVVKCWRLRPLGALPLTEAQITAGGAATTYIEPHTMASKCCPGLYLAGELVDIDGDCGGYNLQWAWSSGFVAGESAAKSLQ